MGIDLTAFPCNCTDGTCAELCVNPMDCVNRIARTGTVRTVQCGVCGTFTWHLNGSCLACEWKKDHLK